MIDMTACPDSSSTLKRRAHIDKLINGLTKPLSRNFENLVPAQAWVVYWITHSLSLLEQENFLESVSQDVIGFMKECAHKDGGYGGGPGQIAHLATTYAAVNALITTSKEEALESIDRIGLLRFLHRMKQSDGSFTLHDDGEIDSRASYCALSILKCLNINDSNLLENVGEWILSCQTYEGGFGAVPGCEAHGGYTFCCVASLCLLNRLQQADIPALLRWLTNKQLCDEGGFCGRSNKLVDSCYSFWQGATFPLVHSFLSKCKLSPHKGANVGASSRTRSSSQSASSSRMKSEKSPSTDEERGATKELDDLLNDWLMDSGKLQDYILNQCQEETGLLRDKPGVVADFYHTCYALSGLSISQHQPDGHIFDLGARHINIVGATHPLFNLTLANLYKCFDYFNNQRLQNI